MSTGKVQRPKEGDGKDPIVGPRPHCGKFVPNDVIQRFQAERYPEPFVWCPSLLWLLCSPKKRVKLLSLYRQKLYGYPISFQIKGLVLLSQ